MNYWFDSFGSFCSKSYKKNLAKWQNNIEFQIQFHRGLNIHQDEFVWENLPKTADEKTIERQTIFRGTSAFYEMPKTGAIVTLGAGIGGRISMNGKPLTSYLYGWDGTHFEAEIYWPEMENEATAKSVLIADNDTYFPPIFSIEAGARRIAEAKRNLDLAAKNAKFPFMVYCTEEQKRAILSIYNDMQENQPIILVAKGNDVAEETTTTMSTNLKEGVLKELWDYYKNTENDVFNDWGIDMNQNNDKKERMTIAEVEGNTEFVKIVNGYRLRKRQEAAENANKLWGLNIKVRYRYEDETHDTEIAEMIKDKEDKENDETTAQDN